MPNNSQDPRAPHPEPASRVLPSRVREWNSTHRPYPLDRSTPWFLENQASKTPELPAVVAGGETLTYRELNHQVNELAHHLRGLGVGPDTLVGVLMERSLEMVVALLGIVKAGGAYVPFDPDYPSDRLAFMVQDSEVKIVLGQEARKGSLPSETIAICLDSDEWLVRRRASTAENPPIRVQPDNLVYMIYTSGSTGKPKGVPNVHRGLVNRILWMQETFQIGPQDRVLQKTPFSFDVSVWEFFWPLMTGACLVMARPGGHKDTAYLLATIAQQGITTMHFVPSMLSLFLTADGIENLSCLRRVMCSGEALPFELSKRFFARLPGVELHNLYGPTEAAIDVTHWPCKADSTQNVVPIGFPIANTQMYILAEDLSPVPVGEVGELHIGGVNLARGYWRRDQLTRERFIRDPFSADEQARLYKTGDLARYLPDGAIEYLGRLDFQVKIRGFRIELGEIEAALLKHTAIQDAVVTATEDALAEKQLVAYLVARGASPPSVRELREWLLVGLPDHMVPARFVFLDALPLLPNGKVDRKALPKDEACAQRPALAQMYVAPKNPLEVSICRIWQSVLHIESVGTQDNFFELGGNSLLALHVAAELRKLTGKEVPVVKLFQFPSVGKLAANLSGEQNSSNRLVENADERATRMRIGRFVNNPETDGVAVIGMVGRFPGAPSLDELWANLCNGVESISRFTLDEIGPGVDDETKNDPDYVPTRGILEDADKFDAQFFGIGPLEAKSMDPQQRVFLELAWAALENAGYSAKQFPGMIGVYAGVGDNHYYTTNVLCHPRLVKTVGKTIVGYGNEKDYIATRVSYALNLTGPAVSVNTGCSTSLLAVDLAFKSLLDFECDMALAGGVDIFVPQRSGQLYQEGGTFTKDGHCRPFDAMATGTMFCDGAGIVVLKRLEDAIADGDQIYAVVRGSAKNNDGANKVSFLAPSVEGQAQVVMLAQAQANFDPDTISYIEAHGTATPLGDPIEITALTKAFAARTDKKQFCFIGSIKGNIGHPTIASGVAGFIKVCLALHHEKIPGTLHYRSPNSQIDFDNSPFKVVAQTTPWPRGHTPRRAGVSSFGFGGTNVHVLLEEAPQRVPSGATRREQLLLFSAKTPAALERVRGRFADFLSAASSSLADVAYTLQQGREHLACREYLVCDSAENAVNQLRQTTGVRKGRQVSRLDPHVAFMFTGQGAQYVNMGRSFYEDEPVWRDTVNRCCDILRPHLEQDLRGVLYPAPGEEKQASECLNNTYYTQPALFVFEYALSQLWISLGIKPSAMVGHSIGEFVAACLSGVFTLEDVLPLVALRGRLMSELPPGTMLSVGCAGASIEGRLPPEVQLAAANSPNLCVLSGPAEAIDKLNQQLKSEGLRTTRLNTSHAFHSKMMDPAVAPFVEAVRQAKAAKPSIPFISTCTGQWITDELATSPEYWGRHLRMPVRFSDAITQMLREGDRTLLEVGPREVLATLARQHASPDQRTRIVASLGGNPDNSSHGARLLTAVGELWLNGSSIDWDGLHQRERRHRLPLPTYPFEREVHWVDPVAATEGKTVTPVTGKAKIEQTPVKGETKPASVGQPPNLMRKLIAMLERISGVAYPDDFDGSMSFAQLGLDSLFLTQLAFTVKEEFGVKVSMRQLLEDCSNLQLLERRLLAERPELAATGTQESPETVVVEPARQEEQAVAATPESETERGGLADACGFSPAGVARTLRAQSDTIELLARQLDHGRLSRELALVSEARQVANIVQRCGHGGLTAPGVAVQIQKTVAAMADEAAAEDGVVNALAAAPELLAIPTNGFQREILDLARADAHRCSPAFNESVSVSLSGTPFSVAAMREALRELVNRHEVLRAAVSADGSQVLVHPSATLHVPLTDLSPGVEAERIRKLAERVESNFAAPFDLRQGPIFRAEIIRMASDLHIIVLTSHLVVCDGWSLDVLVSELGTLYSRRMGLAVPALPPPERYSDYVREREHFATSEEHKRSGTFWQSLLGERPDTGALPARAPHPIERTFRGRRLDLELDPRMVRALKKVGINAGCSFFTVLVAGFKVALRQICGGRRQLIGMPTAGQNTLDKPNLVGNCLDYVPILSTMDDETVLSQYLKSLRATILDAIDNSRYELSVVKRQWPAPKPGRVPFIPVCLNMSPKMGADKLVYGNHRVRYDVCPRSFESFELFVNAVTGDGDTLLLQFQYNDSLFTVEEVRRWQAVLTGILTRMAEGRDEKLARYLEAPKQDLKPADGDSLVLHIVSEMCRFEPAAEVAPSAQISADLCQQLLDAQSEAIRSLVRRVVGEQIGAGGEPSPLVAGASSPTTPRLPEAGDVPLTFGHNAELFGLCRMPERRRSGSLSGAGVLFGYPIGQEAIRSHWAFRLLSNFLLQRGFPVFKFDYYGTGDSLGDMTEADIDRWVDDLFTATAEFKAATGVATISLVALRYGAIIAAKAVEKGLAVDDLVLWDPVASGAAYLREIKQVQQGIVRLRTDVYPFPKEEFLEFYPDEIAGFRYGSKLQQQIESSRLLGRMLAGAARVHVVVSEANESYRALRHDLQRTIGSLSYREIFDDGAWDKAEFFERALLPSSILDSIAKTISRED